MIKPGTHHWNAQQRVVYGRKAAEAIEEQVRAAGAGRVLVATTRSLSSGSLVAGVIAALGPRCAGKFDAIRAHTPRESVLAGAEPSFSAAKSMSSRGTDAGPPPTTTIPLRFGKSFAASCTIGSSAVETKIALARESSKR